MEQREKIFRLLGSRDIEMSRLGKLLARKLKLTYHTIFIPGVTDEDGMFNINTDGIYLASGRKIENPLIYSTEDQAMDKINDWNSGFVGIRVIKHN